MILMNSRLTEAFFRRHVLEVAPDLLGKMLVRRFENEELIRLVITEVEAYTGKGDRACHASKGSTPRTEVMFREGGLVYVYLIYGIHWLLNFVTGRNGDASAVLIRGIQGFQGPGKVGKALKLDKTFYGESLADSHRIWVEDMHKPVHYMTAPRIGIGYAGEPWISKPWRYILTPG